MVTVTGRPLTEEGCGKLRADLAFRDRVRTLIVDVTKQESSERQLNGTAKEAGRLDMLFNNAGIFKPMLFETGTLTTGERAMTIPTCGAAFAGCRLPFRSCSGAGIRPDVNTSSWPAPRALPDAGDLRYDEICCRRAVRKPVHEYAEKGIRLG